MCSVHTAHSTTHKSECTCITVKMDCKSASRHHTAHSVHTAHTHICISYRIWSWLIELKVFFSKGFQFGNCIISMCAPAKKFQTNATGPTIEFKQNGQTHLRENFGTREKLLHKRPRRRRCAAFTNSQIRMRR